MTQFKVGDRVRVVDASGTTHAQIGDTGTVQARPYKDLVTVDLDPQFHRPPPGVSKSLRAKPVTAYTMFDHRFKLIADEPKFRKGDRVKCIKASTVGGPENSFGVLGHIYTVAQDCRGRDFEALQLEGIVTGRAIGCKLDRFELFEQPDLKLGDKVRCTRSFSEKNAPKLGQEMTIIGIHPLKGYALAHSTGFWGWCFEKSTPLAKGDTVQCIDTQTWKTGTWAKSELPQLGGNYIVDGAETTWGTITLHGLTGGWQADQFRLVKRYVPSVKIDTGLPKIYWRTPSWMQQKADVSLDTGFHPKQTMGRTYRGAPPTAGGETTKLFGGLMADYEKQLLSGWDFADLEKRIRGITGVKASDLVWLDELTKPLPPHVAEAKVGDDISVTLTGKIGLLDDDSVVFTDAKGVKHDFEGDELEAAICKVTPAVVPPKFKVGDWVHYALNGSKAFGYVAQLLSRKDGASGKDWRVHYVRGDEGQVWHDTQVMSEENMVPAERPAFKVGDKVIANWAGRGQPKATIVALDGDVAWIKKEDTSHTSSKLKYLSFDTTA
jgi:hypothetical protein